MLDFYLHGERQRRALCPDQRESLAMAQRILEEKRKAEGGGGRALPGEVTVREVVSRYLRMRRDRLPAEVRGTPRKHRTYRIDEDRLEWIASRFPTRVRLLSKRAVLDLVSDRMAERSDTDPGQTISRTTATKPVLLLMAALNWAAAQDLCRNPLAGLRLPCAKGKEIRRRRRAMTLDEHERFRAAAVAMDVELRPLAKTERVPQAPFYLAAFASGRRLGELLNLEWADVLLDADPPCWRFWDTKGMKLAKGDGDEPETYPVPPQVLPYVEALKKMRERTLGRAVGAGDRVFVSPLGAPLLGDNARRYFRRILRRAGIERADHRGRTLDIHAARTTLYSRAAEAGIPLDQAMVFIGHKDVRTALRNYRVPEAISKRDIAEKLAGLSAAARPERPAEPSPTPAVPPTPSVSAPAVPSPGTDVIPVPAPAHPAVRPTRPPTDWPGRGRPAAGRRGRAAARRGAGGR